MRPCKNDYANYGYIAGCTSEGPTRPPDCGHDECSILCDVEIQIQRVVAPGDVGIAKVRNRWTPWARDEMCRMREEGASLAEIGERFGIAPRTAKNVIYNSRHKARGLPTDVLERKRQKQQEYQRAWRARRRGL